MTILDRLRSKSQAYKKVFSGVHGEAVLSDLVKYCHHKTPTFVPNDPYASAFGEGRRDVFNRILAQLDLTESQISKIQETHND